MAQLFRAGCMLAVLCLAIAQNNEDLDKLISHVYPEHGENTTTNNPPAAGQAGGINLTSSNTGDEEAVDGTANCTCVPYYMCKKSPADSTNPKPCEEVFDICCVEFNP